MPIRRSDAGHEADGQLGIIGQDGADTNKHRVARCAQAERSESLLRIAVRSRREEGAVFACCGGSGGDHHTGGRRMSLPGSTGTDLTRRDALSRGGRLLIAAAGGSAAASLAGSGSSLARGSARANWGALARSLRGPLLRPGDVGFRAASAAENYLYASVVPAGIALCAGPKDVERCVRWARDNHVPLVARSGGHSFGGYSGRPASRSTFGA